MSEETRRVLRITGADRSRFLNDLVTNDLKGLESGLVYAALLTPQGKYLFDFFLAADGESILLDVDAGRADGLVQRLSMYKLRADVGIADAGLFVHRGIGELPDGAMADPRHPALGWRMYSETPQEADTVDWDALRVAHCVPETDVELIADGSFILECGFERLNGVDFRKGCYVGQEVTARMKHKTELRKGLATVNVDGSAPVGTDLYIDGKAAGTLYTQSGGQGIAYLRFDRVKGEMQAGDAIVTLPEAG
ncbi:CAF17-like 4Fe-4S cluster assembly/insertion protein YgfZ [Neptunicoccus cionae]|uniref:CAF17-like 4Fe-4S cluster assembly/insertion protein YgfZ n=1 Tax=Neptunicoccus cionae TaxID=2035344 RepID=UPI000C789D04|nr:folate-binding protein YgfZ [Amylibacter cionae]PLS23585.1 folate-binding protein YgfZ [Amylibacter cionae]